MQPARFDATEPERRFSSKSELCERLIIGRPPPLSPDFGALFPTPLVDLTRAPV